VKVVLHELLRNAIEFGTGPIEIELEHFDGGVNIQLMNLPGFSQIALDHLFEPGFTTKQDDPRHSGRGLWLTRRLLHPTVGDVIAGNDKQGKAHITVMVNDLRAE
jgi:signal transduction histidine kinase